MCRTNPEAFRSRGFFQIVRDEGFSLYRGASWTAARNAPGSFAVRRLKNGKVKQLIDLLPPPQLFGGSAFTKEYVFGLQDYRSATWYQNFIASIAGSVGSRSPKLSSALALMLRPLQVSSIAISQPLDVIKVSRPSIRSPLHAG